MCWSLGESKRHHDAENQGNFQRKESVMSFDTQEKPWICSPAAANLLQVGSIIRDIGEPCLQYSAKGSRVLRPERWCASFDDNGRIVDFDKALKIIMLGGVDPSIRAEVWEFLIGCYAISSTAEHRKQLRITRRARYDDLIRKCQQMHPSVGTGTLAYAVGSKVMDVRNQSKDENRTADDIFSQISQESPSGSARPTTIKNGCVSTSCKCGEGFCSSVEIACSTENPDLVAFDSSNDSFSYTGGDLYGVERSADSYFDLPALPVTDLFENVCQNMVEEDEEYKFSRPQKRKIHNDYHHSFQINESADLLVRDSPSFDVRARVTSYRNSNFEARGQQMDLKDFQRHRMSLDRTEALYDQDITIVTAHGSCRMIDDNRRVNDWLWTLHRIVVDVVRTDNHLAFYGDKKNVARMSDILAVYAWVDPSTGYCQGMSDLLSPFVVLYEDNADAFWCFEMLLRRMRQNFHAEGPTGVLKQLEGLGRIMELTDFEMSRHLSAIGAESYLFAFRMLLVLFRRELSFDAALKMWEMLWAADFDEVMLHELEDSCPEPLVLQLATNDTRETNEKDSRENSRNSSGCQTSLEKHVSRNIDTNSDSIIPFCGFRPTRFLTRTYNLQNNAPILPLVRNRDDELAVFCVTSVLIVNRTKIMKHAHSMDDIIKMVNDNKLRINVRKCVRMAIRLRKKYFYKLIKKTNNGNMEQ